MHLSLTQTQMYVADTVNKSFADRMINSFNKVTSVMDLPLDPKPIDLKQLSAEKWLLLFFNLISATGAHLWVITEYKISHPMPYMCASMTALRH